MTDDDREGFKPQDAPDDAGDPAAAFEALRRSVEKQGAQLGAEMTIIRRGVEAAFDKFEKFKEPTDYGSDLGKIIQFLAVVEERLEAIEQSPALRNGPEHYARALERGGESLISTAARQLEHQAIDLERSANSLARRLAGARERYVQDRWLWGAGAAGLLAGVLLTLFLPRVLPGSVDMTVASTVMNDERWKAGIALMQSGNPGGWQSIVDSSQLVRDNAEVISRCANVARASDTDQRCIIVVKTPG